MSIPRNPRDELAEKLADRILLDAVGSASILGDPFNAAEDAEEALLISSNLQAALKGRGRSCFMPFWTDLAPRIRSSQALSVRPFSVWRDFVRLERALLRMRSITQQRPSETMQGKGSSVFLRPYD